MITYFTLDNDWIGFIECPIRREALRFDNYIDAVNGLHEKLQDEDYNWLNDEHPKSKWSIDMVVKKSEDDEEPKRTLVYRISARKAKKLIPTKKFSNEY